MACLNCNGARAEYSFDALEVHTLHVRDFGGERVIQALGERVRFEVCGACASEEVRASLFPAVRVLRKCWGFGVVLAVGAVLSLTLTLSDEMIALRVIGPLGVFVGVSGIVGRVREVLARRKVLEAMSESERLRDSAWVCALRNAPKKFGDNDITYIPINSQTMSMTEAELSDRYNLIPAIASLARKNLWTAG